jgi:cytidylate kinase
MIIAVDGTVASGKSSAARRLAQRLGFTFINTGLMYRGVAAWCRLRGIPTTDQHAVAQHVQALTVDLHDCADGQHVLVNDEDLTAAATAPDIGAYVSDIADNTGVRAVLVRAQQRLGRTAGNAVLEGRDIGSIVFPDAEVKFFVDADVRERARRRQADDIKRHPGLTLDAVERATRARDERDRTRPVGALVRMPDAIMIDTTRNSGPDETVAQMLTHLASLTGQTCLTSPTKNKGDHA